MSATLNVFGVLAIICGIAWVILSIFVLHFSELDKGRFKGIFQLWPFYQVMKDDYPDASRVGRLLFILGNLVAIPWVIGKALGLC